MRLDFKNIVLFIISFSVIFLLLLLVINSNNVNKINMENIKTKRSDYPVYDVDEEVKLVDNSEWFILKSSGSYDKEVDIISKNKVNDQVVDNVDYFLSDIYMDKLCKSLSVSREQISDVRLLNDTDIRELLNLGSTDFNIKFDISKYKLLSNSTIVNYYLNDKRLSLCGEGFCDNDNSDIRVVVKINKFFVKK